MEAGTPPSATAGPTRPSVPTGAGAPDPIAAGLAQADALTLSRIAANKKRDIQGQMDDIDAKIKAGGIGTSKFNELLTRKKALGDQLNDATQMETVYGEKAATEKAATAKAREAVSAQVGQFNSFKDALDAAGVEMTPQLEKWSLGFFGHNKSATAWKDALAIKGIHVGDVGEKPSAPVGAEKGLLSAQEDEAYLKYAKEHSLPIPDRLRPPAEKDEDGLGAMGKSTRIMRTLQTDYLATDEAKALDRMLKIATGSDIDYTPEQKAEASKKIPELEKAAKATVEYRNYSKARDRVTKDSGGGYPDWVKTDQEKADWDLLHGGK